jgi:hypothetical protein
MLVSCVALNTRAAAAQGADGSAADALDQIVLPPVPPTEVTSEEAEAANANIPFYNARVEMSNARATELCAALAKTSGGAQGLPAVNHYFARYAKRPEAAWLPGRRLSTRARRSTRHWRPLSIS